MTVYLEYGIRWPRSGGELHYVSFSAFKLEWNMLTFMLGLPSIPLASKAGGLLVFRRFHRRFKCLCKRPRLCRVGPSSSGTWHAARSTTTKVLGCLAGRGGLPVPVIFQDALHSPLYPYGDV